MRTYKWSQKYEIGFEPVDDQHKYFLDLINKLLINHRKEKRILVLLLEELRSYTKFHFQSEENYMVIHGYKEYDAHKIEHEILLKEMAQKIGEFKTGTINLKNIVLFIIKSSITHILEVDKIVGIHLKNSEG